MARTKQQQAHTAKAKQKSVFLSCQNMSFPRKINFHFRQLAHIHVGLGLVYYQWFSVKFCRLFCLVEIGFFSTKKYVLRLVLKNRTRKNEFY